MSPLWLDIEVLSDREEELQALYAALTEDETEHNAPQTDNELPPGIQDEVPDTGPGERRRDNPSIDKAERFADSSSCFLQGVADEEEE